VACAQLNERTVEISELPVGKWTQDYKEFLETLVKPEEKDTVRACTAVAPCCA
jgi:hypothetical protein